MAPPSKAPLEKRSTGIPKLPLLLGGFAVLILLVTVLTRVVGPSPEEPPPSPPAASPPRLDPVALDAPAEADRPPPEPSPPPSPAPASIPAAAPTAQRQEPLPPPKRLFADECAEVIVRDTVPSYRAYEATHSGPNQTPPPTVLKRLAHAGKACECIEGIYRRLGLTDLRGDDARSTYEQVLGRHGIELRPALFSLFVECERRAR
jgi:hypothetical protein